MTTPHPLGPATPHQAARAYAALGLRVIPITPHAKHPPVPAWQDAATTDLTIVDNWWRNIYRDYGVGIAPGPLPDGRWLFVLDIDVSDGKAGDETLLDLCDSYGPLPDTPEVITGSGGRHIYLCAPYEIRNNAGRLGPGIDVRGVGGQVLAPPTVHPNGRPYLWTLDADPWTIPFADAPGWFLALLERHNAPPPPELRPATVHLGDRPGDRWAKDQTWAQLLQTDGWAWVGRGPEGEDRWRRPGKDDGISATTGYRGSNVLKVFTTSIPELTPDATYTMFGYLAATRHHGDHRACARALGPDLARAYSEVTTATPAAPEGPDGTTAPGLAAWLLDWPSAWNNDHTAEDWLLEPIIANGRGHSLWAGAKTGKSYVLLPMAAAIATGRPYLGYPGGAPRDVLYVDYEMTTEDVIQRLEEFGYGPDDDLSRFRYILLPSIAGLDTADGAQALMEAVRAWNPALVVIDTISRAVEGPENDADTLRAFYRHTGLALKSAGVAWIRLDHGGKDLAKGQRGSSAKNDDVDVVWKLSRTDTGVLFEATHRRMSWVPEKVALVRRDDDGVVRFTLAAGPQYPAGTAEIIAILDDLGVPSDASRRTCAAALRDAGKGFRAAVLAAAVKSRKSDFGVGNHAVPAIHTSAAGDHGNHLAKPQVRGPEPSWEPSGTTRTSSGSRVFPPLGGTTEPATSGTNFGGPSISAEEAPPPRREHVIIPGFND